MSLPKCPKCGTQMEIHKKDLSKTLTVKGFKAGLTAGHLIPGIGHLYGAITGAAGGAIADIMTISKGIAVNGRDRIICPNCLYEIDN